MCSGARRKLATRGTYQGSLKRLFGPTLKAGVRVQGSGFRVQGSEFKVQGSEFCRPSHASPRAGLSSGVFGLVWLLRFKDGRRNSGAKQIQASRATVCNIV